MTLVICTGFHDSRLTEDFLGHLGSKSVKLRPYIIISPFSCLNEAFSLGEDLTLIGFSAGVVNAIALAHYWQAQIFPFIALVTIILPIGVPVYWVAVKKIFMQIPL